MTTQKLHIKEEKKNKNKTIHIATHHYQHHHHHCHHSAAVTLAKSIYRTTKHSYTSTKLYHVRVLNQLIKVRMLKKFRVCFLFSLFFWGILFSFLMHTKKPNYRSTKKLHFIYIFYVCGCVGAWLWLYICEKWKKKLIQLNAHISAYCNPWTSCKWIEQKYTK